MGCYIHGLFLSSPDNYLSSYSGCPECSKSLIKKPRIKSKEIIKLFNVIHNNYYTYIDLPTYSDKPINIVCPTHGSFSMTPHHHKQGRGCKECKKNKKQENGGWRLL